MQLMFTLPVAPALHVAILQKEASHAFLDDVRINLTFRSARLPAGPASRRVSAAMS